MIKYLVKIIAMLNNRLPAVMELEFARVQGKGFGGESFFEEAEIALRFCKQLNDKTYLSNSLIKKKDLIIFDVGANIGSYTESILKLSPNSQIFAFEPSAISGAIFLDKFKEKTNVHFFNLALSNETSFTTLFSDYLGSPISSLAKRRLDHFGKNFFYEEKIATDTLDGFCAKNNLVPDILKMDVEGHEFNILLGALKIINKISVIQFEFGGCNIDTRTFFQDFWYFFKEHQFTVYRITPIGVNRIREYTESDEYFLTTNFVAVNNRISNYM